MEDTAARKFAREWYAAWNAHDLDRILDHYADDVEMASPLVADLTGRADNRIVGKDALRAYFAAGLEAYPTLRFEPLGLYVGVDSLVLHYLSVNGRPSAEVVFLDDEGRIARYVAHYATADHLSRSKFVPPRQVPWPASPGVPCVWGVWTMLSIGPWFGFMSFSPLKAQIELAFVNAPVCFPEPENAMPGVPGGPCTSPARAAPPPAPASATAQIAAAKVVRM